MSLIRVCDCRCHEFDHDGAPSLLPQTARWWQFGSKDVCGPCLDGDGWCKYWQPRVLRDVTPRPFDEIMCEIYTEKLLAGLRGGPLFKALP